MKIQVIEKQEEFFDKFFSELPAKEVEALGDSLWDLETEIISSTEKLLVPKLGRWEQSDIWWHQMDYHADGKRELNFIGSVFNIGMLAELQALLTGSMQVFAFLIQIPKSMDELGNNSYGEVGVFSDRIIATRAFVNKYGEDA